MLIRMSYDRPVDEIKAAVRASARLRTLDNMAKVSSDVLYLFFGNLVILFFRRGVWSLRFSGYFSQTRDGKTKLFGGFGIFPFEPLIALPLLLFLAFAAFYARGGPLDALFRVLLILLTFIAMYLLLQAVLALFRKNREQGLLFLRNLGEKAESAE